MTGTVFTAVFLLSLLPALLLAPFWRDRLHGHSWSDAPRSDRHHSRAVSKAGGAAWTAAVLVGLFSAAFSGPDLAAPLMFVPAIIASFALGRLDDLGLLGPGLKLLLQTAVLAALLLWLRSSGVLDACGISSKSVVAAVVAALLLQTALGIFDNMDGALSSVASGALALAAVGAAPAAFRAVAVAGLGATLGFLIWNRPPARLFLGNAGSQPLALLVTALVFLSICKAGRTGAPWERELVVLLPLSWPVFDLVFVSFSRIRSGSVPWRGGRDHTTHRLARRLGSDTAAFAAILAVTISATMAGFVLLLWTR